MEGCIILHVDSEKPWRGGEQQLLYLVKGLKNKGCANYIACPKKSALYKRAKNEGLIVFDVPLLGEWDLYSVWQLARLIKKLKINIVHVHSSHAHTLVALAAKLLGKCKIVLTRRVDFKVAQNFFSTVKYNSGADVIIAISEQVRQVLVENGVPSYKIQVVYDGIDLKEFSSNIKGNYLYQELNLDPNKPIVGNIAALAPHKDQKNLLLAIKEVQKETSAVKFLIVGEGELEKELKNLAKDLEIEDKVIFTGFRNDIPQILSILNLFAVSSYLEGLGSSTLEAMAMGLPVVATDTGGITEIVRPGVTGLLVPTKDPQALARGIIELLQNKEMAKRMGQMGKEMATRFSVERMVEGNWEVYRQLMGKG